MYVEFMCLVQEVKQMNLWRNCTIAGNLAFILQHLVLLSASSDRSLNLASIRLGRHLSR